MTGLRHLFNRRPARHSAGFYSRVLSTNSRREESEPIQPCVGLIAFGLGGVLALGALLELIFAGQGDTALLMLLACPLLLFGSAQMLFVLGQHIVSRRKRMKENRCGYCQFFEVPIGLYVVGRCQADPARHLVSRTDSCSSFCFSERAMVRDHLGQHSGVLKQLRITRTIDVSNQ